jgi:2-amino-4-hydroxy-6-hydroxymethyldihydropteridine diphosphokinase
MEEQPWFVNGVAGVATGLTPAGLLGFLLQIEAGMGRVRRIPGGPRTIDLDILLYGDRVVRGPELWIPHPRMHRRRFVLAPLCEIAPQLRHPGLGKTVRELLESLKDDKAVERLGPLEVSPC